MYNCCSVFLFSLQISPIERQFIFLDYFSTFSEAFSAPRNSPGNRKCCPADSEIVPSSSVPNVADCLWLREKMSNNKQSKQSRSPRYRAAILCSIDCHQIGLLKLLNTGSSSKYVNGNRNFNWTYHHTFAGFLKGSTKKEKYHVNLNFVWTKEMQSSHAHTAHTTFRRALWVPATSGHALQNPNIEIRFRSLKWSGSTYPWNSNLLCHDSWIMGILCKPCLPAWLCVFFRSICSFSLSFNQYFMINLRYDMPPWEPVQSNFMELLFYPTGRNHVDSFWWPPSPPRSHRPSFRR